MADDDDPQVSEDPRVGASPPTAAEQAADRETEFSNEKLRSERLLAELTELDLAEIEADRPNF